MKPKKIYLCCEAKKRNFFTEKANRMYQDYPMVEIVPEAQMADSIFIIGTETEQMQTEIQNLKESFPNLDMQRVNENFVNPDIYKLIRDSKTVKKTTQNREKEMGR